MPPIHGAEVKQCFEENPAYVDTILPRVANSAVMHMVEMNIEGFQGNRIQSSWDEASGSSVLGRPLPRPTRYNIDKILHDDDDQARGGEYFCRVDHTPHPSGSGQTFLPPPA